MDDGPGLIGSGVELHLEVLAHTSDQMDRIGDRMEAPGQPQVLPASLIPASSIPELSVWETCIALALLVFQAKHVSFVVQATYIEHPLRSFQVTHAALGNGALETSSTVLVDHLELLNGVFVVATQIVQVTEKPGQFWPCTAASDHFQRTVKASAGQVKVLLCASSAKDAQLVHLEVCSSVHLQPRT